MMISFGRFVLALVSAAVLATTTGCSLSQAERQKIARWEEETASLGHPEVKYAELVDPATAVGLSFLPFGIGGFYVHRPGMGVSGILCWPLSLMWMPAMAGPSAVNYNIETFRQRVVDLREEEQANQRNRAADPRSALDRIDQLHREGRISDGEYQDLRKRTLELMTTP